MAKQTIGIGSSANDGTGDALRDAFDKINDNFTESYTGDYGALTLSSAGNTNVAIPTAVMRTTVASIAANANTHTLSLVTTSAVAGQIQRVYAEWASSSTATLEVYNASTGGTLLFTHTADTNGTKAELLFVFTGSAWVVAGNNITVEDSSGAASEVAITGTTTITSAGLATDFSQIIWHVCSGTSANYTVTLPAVSGQTGKYIGFRMASGLTKLVTLDGNGSETIDGTTTRIMWANETAVLFCNGSEWTKVFGRSVPMTARGQRDASFSATTTTVVTVPLDTVTFSNPAAIVNTTDGRIDILRPGSYVVTAALNYENMSANTNTQVRIAKNGVSAAPASVSVTTGTGTYPAMSCSLLDSAVAGDYYTLDTFQTTGGSAPLFVDDHCNWLSLQEVPTW